MGNLCGNPREIHFFIAQLVCHQFLPVVETGLDFVPPISPSAASWVSKDWGNAARGGYRFCMADGWRVCVRLPSRYAVSTEMVGADADRYPRVLSAAVLEERSGLAQGLKLDFHGGCWVDARRPWAASRILPFPEMKKQGGCRGSDTWRTPRGSGRLAAGRARLNWGGRCVVRNFDRL